VSWQTAAEQESTKSLGFHVPSYAESVGTVSLLYAIVDAGVFSDVAIGGMNIREHRPCFAQ